MTLGNIYQIGLFSVFYSFRVNYSPNVSPVFDVAVKATCKLTGEFFMRGNGTGHHSDLHLQRLVLYSFPSESLVLHLRATSKASTGPGDPQS